MLFREKESPDREVIKVRKIPALVEMLARFSVFSEFLDSVVTLAESVYS